MLDPTRFTTAVARGLSIAAAVFLLAQPHSLSAQQPRYAAGKAEITATDAADEPLLRLNYLPTSWERVLHDLADKTGSTLVLHDVPRGRFQRTDRRKYNRSEAIRILNQELEPLGFRILAKDQFLTVIEIDRRNEEYPRRVYQPTPQEPIPRAYEPATASADRRPPATQPSDNRRPSQRRSDRIVDSSVRPAAYEEAQHQETVEARSETAERSTVTLDTDQPAADVARKIYGAFGKRTEFVEAGPQGLPAFHVYRGSSDPGEAESATQTKDVWFTVELDQSRNQLHLHGADSVTDSLVKLVHLLDVAPAPGAATTRVIPDAGNAGKIARQLEPQLAQLQDARKEAAQNEPAAPDDETAPDAPAQSDPLDPSQLGDMPLPQLIGNLRGDVTVEALQDLDLLILRGNEADVEAVMEVIRAIEELAIGSTPEIHLLNLRYVDSESLAALLNDVYERLSQLNTDSAAAVRQTKPVNVVPVGRPNAILIIAPGSVMPSVLDLAEQLDQPVTPGSEVEVFPLKSAVSSQVAALIEEFYEDRPGLATQVRVVDDVRTNSVVVNASPAELEEVARLVRQIDRDRARSVNQVKLVPLEYALADELAEFLTLAIQSILNPQQAQGQLGQFGGAGAQGSEDLQEPKSVVLEFLTTDGSVQRLLRSGLLADVRITADLRTNRVMITAPEASMPLFVELVKVLDQPTNAVADIKVHTLENADATAVAELLLTLFPEPDEDEPGIQVAGSGDAGASLIPLRVSVDTRTNSLVIVASRDVMAVVEAILYRLDAGDLRNRRIEVLRLRNNPAQSIADAINVFLQSQRDLLLLDPDLISSTELLQQEVIVTPEPLSNNLIISATPRYFDQIRDLALELDREPEQVVIQALLVEVTLDDTDELGMELGFQDPVLFDRSLLTDVVTITETIAGVDTTRVVSVTGAPGFGFNNQPFGNNVIGNPGRVGTQGLSNFALGRTNDDLGFGGLVLSASSDSVSVLVRALASRRDVRVLSRPQVTALDNQIAQVQVGQQVPIVDGVNITAQGIANPNIIQDEAGIILTVTPRISPDGQIVMEVVAEKSAFLGDGVPIFTDTDGAVITSPIKDITTALTSVKVPDGQTIVIGGMITKTEDNDHRKVPYLGDIPLIGSLFRYDSSQHRRTELLIFLTPRIVRTDADMELIKHVEFERMHAFEDEVEQIHGPIFGIPSAQGGLPAAYPGAVNPPAPGSMRLPTGPAIPEVPVPPAPEVDETQPRVPPTVPDTDRESSQEPAGPGVRRLP